MRTAEPLSAPARVATQGRRRGFVRNLISLEFGVLLVLLTGMLAGVIFFAQYSGMVRWLLFVFLLLAGLWLAGRFVYLRAQGATSLQHRPPTLGIAGGRLRDLTGTLALASGGRPYSQLVFAMDMRDALLEKVMAETGYSGTLVDLVHDPPILKALLRDRELFDFVSQVSRLERTLTSYTGSEEELFPASSDGFLGEVDRMLSRIEEWP